MFSLGKATLSFDSTFALSIQQHTSRIQKLQSWSCTEEDQSIQSGKVEWGFLCKIIDDYDDILCYVFLLLLDTQRKCLQCFSSFILQQVGLSPDKLDGQRLWSDLVSKYEIKNRLFQQSVWLMHSGDILGVDRQELSSIVSKKRPPYAGCGVASLALQVFVPSSNRLSW